ncbi:MAG: TIGR03936 family radical SAM-associated protein [Lachnospiraceae bacterium]|nr:TIGR03936 family radical SAM-associated protein [Lachnospiraceae bacterium]
MKFRIKFMKTGSMKFIGHLDVMRYFQKVFRRAGIIVKLTEGFSPHPIMSFASPLGIGLTTEGDYLDVTLTDEIFEEDSTGIAEGGSDTFISATKEGGSVETASASEEDVVGEESVSEEGGSIFLSPEEEKALTDKIRERMNQVSHDEIRVLEVVRLPETAKNSMSILASCDYMVFFKEDKLNENCGFDFKSDSFVSDLEVKIKEYLEQPCINVTKKTKKSEKVIDIKDNIYIMTASKEKFIEETGANYGFLEEKETPDLPLFFVRLTAGSVLNIKPEIVIESFLKFMGLEYEEFDYHIHRLDMLRDLNFVKGEVHTLNTEIKCDLVSLGEPEKG